jgi:hypothetical protein
VQLRSINIGKDYGTSLEILGGVSVADLVIINPSDSLEPGQVVNVASVPAENQPQSPSIPKSTEQEENAPEQQQRAIQNSQKGNAR